ncbi:DUF4381 domain-containing protein [Marinomonas epiphytica]
MSSTQMNHASSTVDLPNKAYLLPDSIAMWPPAWWTWPSLAVALALLFLCVLFGYRHYRKNAYRREAIRALLEQANQARDQPLITLCHEMVRRCLVTQHNYHLAAQPSHSLFTKLDEDMPKKLSFELLGEVFIQGAYQAQLHLTDQQRQSMIKTTCHWIRKHHV